MATSGLVDEELVPVMVPRSKLKRVHAVLAEEDGGTVDVAADEGGGEWDDWSPADMQIISDDPRPSFTRASAMLDVLAKKPGKSTSLTDLAAAAGLTVSEVKGALTGFARWAKAEYGEPCTPWTRSWGDSKVNGQQGEFYYSLTTAIAETWKSVRDS